MIVILADDLTGACDAAAPFAAWGLETRVLLEMTATPWSRGDVVAVDLDSRRLTRRTAVARHVAAARMARVNGAASVFKKVDSTLRGHVAAEIMACLRGSGAPFAVLCPAFPAMGRRVKWGSLWVKGRGDVGRVTELAGFALGDFVAPLPRAVSDRDTEALVDALQALCQAGARVVIADANSQHDLERLVEAAGRLRRPPLLAGSAGLAAALAQAEGRRQVAGRRGERWLRAPTQRDEIDPPWLVVAGSQSEATAGQVLELERAGSIVMALDGRELVNDQRLGQRAGEQAASRLIAGKTVVLRLTAAGGEDLSIDRFEDRIVRVLARACRIAVERGQPTGLFLTGGLTARACLSALGVRGLRLESEPLPGIAASRAIGGSWDGLPVVTKAGGFGNPGAIKKLVMRGEVKG